MTPKKVTYKPKIKPKINPSVIAGVGHAEIDDGQHHKNEGLQCDHQQMEDQPAEIQQGLDRQHEVHHGAYRGAAQQRDQQEHQLAGEQIAEQSQHQTEGLGHFFDQTHDDVDRHEEFAERVEQEHLEVADRALHLYVVKDDEQEHRERHREGGIEVGGGHHFYFVYAEPATDKQQQIDEDDIHDIYLPYPLEDGEGERSDQRIVAGERVAHLAAHEVENGFFVFLVVVWLVWFVFAGQPGGDHHHQYCQRKAEENSVDVERPETGGLVGHRITVTHAPVGEVMLNILNRRSASGGAL